MTAGTERRAGRARAVVTTMLDIAGLVAVPFGAGLVAGVGVGLVVGGLAALLASWRIAR